MAAIGALNVPGLAQVDWLIRWNPRSTDRAELAAQIDAGVQDGRRGAVRWEHPRHGKRVALWEQRVCIEGVSRPVRRVLRLVERTISAAGQHLIVPDVELDGWTTTMPLRLGPQQIIDLDADHGTHEQFHAEFKTDLCTWTRRLGCGRSEQCLPLGEFWRQGFADNLTHIVA